MENRKRNEKIENEDSFNVLLTGSVGEKMYFINLQIDKKAVEKDGSIIVLTDENSIQPVIIYKMIYKSCFPVIMIGINEQGEKVTSVQEMFFEKYEDAVSTLKEIKKIYENSRCNKDLYELYEETIEIKYRFIWEFAFERYDIILNSNFHYTIKDIEATIDQQNAQFLALKTEDHMYFPKKKVIQVHNDFVPFKIREL